MNRKQRNHAWRRERKKTDSGALHAHQPAGSKAHSVGHKRGSSPGRNGVKAPYPPVFRLQHPADTARYLPHQSECGCARRRRQMGMA